MKPAVRVTVTGAAGQIGYALLFRIASGAMLGDDQPVILQLLDITPAMEALNGVVQRRGDPQRCVSAWIWIEQSRAFEDEEWPQAFAAV